MKKVKISLRFASWLDILDIPSSIPYILFKLKEIKKNKVLSLKQHTIRLLRGNTTLILFHF